MERADLHTSSAEETERVAAALARELRPGDIVLIAGEVGSGKTTFVRGACRALGVTDSVTSPSFTIGQTYDGPTPVAHVDLFRLDDLGAEDPALLADYLTPERVGFVEWPGAAGSRVDRERVVLEVRLDHEGRDTRRLRARGRPRLVAALRARR